MKATELKIGNWVHYNAFDGVVCSSDIFDIDKGTIKAKPIPLTEEWLKRFGFKLKSWPWEIERLWEIERFEVCIRNESWELFAGCGDEYPIGEIEHVHQLQNLYFALTGEELNQNKEDE